MCNYEEKCPMAKKCELIAFHEGLTLKDLCRLKKVTEEEAPLFHQVLKARE